MSDQVPGDLLEIADALVPGAALGTARLARGGIHDVVLLPGVAAVRVSRRPRGAEELPRRTELLRVIGAAGLPFAVPEPLTPVRTFGNRAAVAVSWLDGAGLPEGQGDPARIGELLQAVRELPVTPELRAVLPAARDHDWARILADEVIGGPRADAGSRPPSRWSRSPTRWSTAISAGTTCCGARTASWSACSTGTAPTCSTPRSTPPS
jgi:hypothetical protein